MDLKIIATLGHTRGTALIYREKFNFTGDHLAWCLDIDGIFNSRRDCQYSWNIQKQSIENWFE